MELRQLEYFCRIVESGSIHEAARRLNMSGAAAELSAKTIGAGAAYRAAYGAQAKALH